MNKSTLKAVIFGGLFIVPFVPFFVSSSFFFPFITTKAFAFRVIVEIVFAAWLILAALEPEYRLRKSLLLYSLATFLAIIGLADIFGVAPVKSFWSNFERMEGYITLIHLGMFFAVMASFFKEKEWRWWWNTSLVASGFMVIYCLFQLLGATPIHQGGVRVDGTLGNATYLAVYMLFHIFIAMFFLWRERKNKNITWMYGVLIFFQVLILYHTATRGAILGLLGGLLLVAVLNIRNRDNRMMRRASIGILSALVLVVGGFFLLRGTNFVQNSPVLSRFANISTEELKGGGRSFVWPMAIEGIKERPILGWGQDNFNYVFNEHYNPNMFHLEPWFDRAHNIFLDWGIAGGILGLFSYLSLYIVLLYLLWFRSEMAYEERTILTGAVAAYFFHNFFVFDQLISYIMFFSLMAYVHGRSYTAPKGELKKISESTATKEIMPAVAFVLIAALYVVNFRPMSANTTLIAALSSLQNEDKSLSMDKFRESYDKSRLGRPEVVEQIATHIQSMLSSTATMEKKNEFFLFAKDAVIKQAEELNTDARYQIVAGSFLSRTGSLTDSLAYFDKATKLIPGKQLVYFEAGNALLNLNDARGALEWFKKAYDLAPEYVEAKVIYLSGAIYAGDRALEEKLINETPQNTYIMDDRIVGAYYSVKRTSDVILILEERIKLDPANASTYQEYIRQVRSGQ